jgi:hypothetical protein
MKQVTYPAAATKAHLQRYANRRINFSVPNGFD